MNSGFLSFFLRPMHEKKTYSALFSVDMGTMMDMFFPAFLSFFLLSLHLISRECERAPLPCITACCFVHHYYSPLYSKLLFPKSFEPSSEFKKLFALIPRRCHHITRFGSTLLTSSPVSALGRRVIRLPSTRKFSSMLPSESWLQKKGIMVKRK